MNEMKTHQPDCEDVKTGVEGEAIPEPEGAKSVHHRGVEVAHSLVASYGVIDSLAVLECLQVQNQKNENDAPCHPHIGGSERTPSQGFLFYIGLSPCLAIFQGNSNTVYDMSQKNHNETELQGVENEFVFRELVAVEVEGVPAHEEEHVSSQVNNEKPHQHDTRARHDDFFPDRGIEKLCDFSHICLLSDNFLVPLSFIFGEFSSFYFSTIIV